VSAQRDETDLGIPFERYTAFDASQSESRAAITASVRKVSRLQTG